MKPSHPNPSAHTGAPPGRVAAVVGGVTLAHLGALWAFTTITPPAKAERVVPVTVMAELLTPPAPQPAPAPAPAPQPPQPKPLPKPKPTPKPRPAPAPPKPTPSQLAPSPITEPSAAAATAPAVGSPPPTPTTSAGPTGPVGPAAPPKVELPSSNAAYLNNPHPSYPALSRRMGEQGRVMLRVLIGADGLPQKVEIKQSSGYERLDRQAVSTVERWRFTPGKRGGVPEAMWHQIPIQFVLD